ncbi:hypothetical protein ACQPYE_26090 [Actinosynnema sp. CA-299493]
MLVAVLGVMGSLMVGGSATAAPADGTTKIISSWPDLVHQLGTTGNAPPENCRELTSTGGARMSLCSAFSPDWTGPTVSGYYRGTVYGETFAQIRVNGGTGQNVTTRPDTRGVFAGVTSVQFRACNSVNCGAWG